MALLINQGSETLLIPDKDLLNQVLSPLPRRELSRAGLLLYQKRARLSPASAPGFVLELICCSLSSTLPQLYLMKNISRQEKSHHPGRDSQQTISIKQD